MRTTGRRTLAGIAAGALAFTGLAFVATPSAQAAQTVAFFCAGNGTGINGSGGAAPDVTTVQPNCSVIASPTAAAPIALSFAGAASGATYGQATIDGPGVWAPLTSGTDGAITNGGKTLTLVASNWISGSSRAIVTVPTAGESTVSLAVSTAANLTQVNASNTTPVGDLTVTGIGATAGIQISNAYTVIDETTGASVALVQVRDEAGQAVPITTSNVTVTAPSTTWNVQRANASSAACVGRVLAASPGAGGALNPNSLINPVPACSALATGTSTNPGVWINIPGLSPKGVPAGFSGPATIGVSVTAGTRTYTGSVTFTVSSALAAAWTLEFDKAEYTPGELASLEICATDVRGLPVPDGLVTSTTRALAAGSINAEVINIATGVQTADASTLFAFNTLSSNTANYKQVSTYEGCTTGRMTVPGTPQPLIASVTSDAPISGTNAGGRWADAASLTTKTATAVVRGETPVVKSMAIVGSRVEGTSQVVVEGTSVGLAGKTVTPYFRFPGETGFTAGTGTRTVDAEGNFNWQRKTGKKIAVQFRGDGVVSNTVIIDAK